jgi:4-diphosphocytidyl-2-C-methyl-D-erythritol kinase
LGVYLENLTVTAPAKLNLHLAVLDKRPDGFHNLESIFVTLNFGDTLSFIPVKGGNSAEIEMEWGNDIPSEELPAEKNIIFRALSLFRDKTGFDKGIKIKAEKNIPPGSGLGGGSSDAAATLLALNKLAGFPLNRDELLEMAAILGSDVPFFIYETGAALVKGRGQCITPLKAPDWFFVLVYPGFSSNTAAAFRLLDEYRTLNKFTTNSYSRYVRETSKIIEECDNTGSWLKKAKIPGAFYNDFLPVFGEPEKSVYQNIISRLRELGADFAGISGAGSTCFGVYEKNTLAEKAALSLRGTWKFIKCCELKTNRVSEQL